jgi:hypothetical protein
MAELLRDYELKRVRALQHLDPLRESMERLTSRHRIRIRGEFDAAAIQYMFHLPLEPINPDWTLLLGDFIYNTRASLDYLVTALVRSTGSEEHESSQFPIYRARQRAGKEESWLQVEQRWEKADDTLNGQLQGTPTGTKAKFKALQPFYGVPRTNPLQHPLLALHTLNNRDKHRRLNLLVHSAEIRFEDASGKQLFEGPPIKTRISESCETVTLNTQKRDADVYLRASYEIRLNEPPELLGNLLATLTSINKFIDSWVLPTVVELLSS